MENKYQIGDRASFSKTISEADVYVFAGVTGDFNPVHIDAREAKKTMFGKRIAHGMLSAGLISAVIGNRLPGSGTIYLEQQLRFLMPVYFGDTCTAMVEIEDILKPEKGIYRLKTWVTNQNGEVVVDGYAVVKYLDKSKIESNRA